jgi:uncharacterized membrane protein YkvA (DUF1232 family)
MRPNGSQEQPAANPDTKADLAGWLFSRDRAHIDEFILAGISGIRSEHLHVITKESQRVYEKIYAAGDAGLSELRAHTRLIMQTLEFAARSHGTEPLPAHLAEGTFAAQYLLKEHDLIPDQLPGIGLIDDAILIKRVFFAKRARIHAGGNSPREPVITRRQTYS